MLFMLAALAPVVTGCSSVAYVAEPQRAPQSNQTNFAGRALDLGVQAGGTNE